MAYNYRKAEKEWLSWKQKEEEQMRALGVDEDTIQRLRAYDWEQFRKGRIFYYWNINAGDANMGIQQEAEEEIYNVDSLLDNIDDERLLQFLQKENRQTLEMVTMWLQGYTANEVCLKMGVSTYTYYNRIKYFKKKMKKFLGSD